MSFLTNYGPSFPVMLPAMIFAFIELCAHASEVCKEKAVLLISFIACIAARVI